MLELTQRMNSNGKSWSARDWQYWKILWDL